MVTNTIDIATIGISKSPGNFGPLVGKWILTWWTWKVMQEKHLRIINSCTILIRFGIIKKSVGYHKIVKDLSCDLVDRDCQFYCRWSVCRSEFKYGAKWASTSFMLNEMSPFYSSPVFHCDLSGATCWYQTELSCWWISLQIRTGTWTQWIRKSLQCNLHDSDSLFPKFRNFALRVLTQSKTQIVFSFHRSCL